MADDVRAVIDDLELKDAVLAGLSTGGAIAVHYMAPIRGMVSQAGLVICGSTCVHTA